MIQRKLILLVEDNPDDVTLTLRAFQKNNLTHRVEVMRNGVEAVDYMLGRGSYNQRDLRDMPDMVLLDVNLPGLNGLEVLRLLRSAEGTRLIPIIMLTTSNEQDDIVRSYMLGANSYVRKPVDYTQFMQTVQQLGMYWLVLNEPVRR